MNKDAPDTEHRALLSQKICDLFLKIEGTLSERVAQLYQELEMAGISFRPKTYLADEWGCPHGVPVIGIPFYLGDQKLCRLEGQMTGIEAEDEAEVMMSLRHEAGHAFNYAYRLYRQAEWRQLFGHFSKSYQDDYKPVPFSARFVRHLPGWYAQKHPDDDFAETFAVWLMPGSDWRQRYADTPALAKLLYVDKIVGKLGEKPPIVTDDNLDTPVQELTMTLDKWYETCRETDPGRLNLPGIIDTDLRRLFPAGQGQPADDFLLVNRIQLAREVNRWTGVNRKLLVALIEAVSERVKAMGLKTGPEPAAVQMASVSVFFTTLAMNYLYRGKFIET